MAIPRRPSLLTLTLASGLLMAATGCTPGSDPVSSSADIEESSPDYYACALPGQEPVIDAGGNWGELGIWCDPDALADIYPGIEEKIAQRYAGLIIRHERSPWNYRKPVIARQVKVLTVSTHIALEQQGVRDSWQTDELDAFMLAMLTTAYQESFFSEYKLIDGKLRLMRGDAGHAHGIMQIYDKWHYDAVYSEDVGWDLLHNESYGIHFFLDKWEAAKQAFYDGKADCVGSGGMVDYHALARSAYAVYNGGNLGAVCRWTDPSASYAKNDTAFETKWQQLASKDLQAEYGWVTSYPAALEGIEHIDFTGILGLTSLPGGACGDGIVSDAEGCDDGNTFDGDGCSATCTVESGYSCGGEPSARSTSCGDGYVALDEACDDGNELDGDGCNAGCGTEKGFACNGEPSYCSSSCGDGVIASDEACDDKNGVDGDGCSACHVDSGYSCDGEPSSCVPPDPPPTPSAGQGGSGGSGSDGAGQGGGPSTGPADGDPYADDPSSQGDPHGDDGGWDPNEESDPFAGGEAPPKGAPAADGGCTMGGPGSGSGGAALMLLLAAAAWRRRRTP
jgi:MYXO-CTERM domain-containing protein